MVGSTLATGQLIVVLSNLLSALSSVLLKRLATGLLVLVPNVLWSVLPSRLAVKGTQERTAECATRSTAPRACCSV